MQCERRWHWNNVEEITDTEVEGMVSGWERVCTFDIETHQREEENMIFPAGSYCVVKVLGVNDCTR